MKKYFRRICLERYNHLNSYLKNKFGKRTLKICIDGNFTCPNRDGSKGKGGCIFCGSLGAGENIKGRTHECIQSILSQVSGFLNSYRGDRAESFVAYFQSFSGTYDSVENLKLKYDTALSVSPKIVGLEVATRPDLISDDIINLLKSYMLKYYVCVELGLQTSNDSIGKKINRGYTTQDFVESAKKLKENGIDVVAHVMVGLPDETLEDVLNTIDLLNECKVNGIKIHNTYVLKNTKLNNLYSAGKYEPISMEYYSDVVCKIISRLNKNIIIHRITGDPPKDILVAPEWASHKKLILNTIQKKLNEENIFQGDNK